jgi:hydroxymethylpyrimidine pyrophosphatase-like HAD family hydrolase
LLARLDGEIAAALGQFATVGRSQPYYLDITAPQANKGDGVAALAAAIGVPLTNVAVLGDEHNNLPMFARAGLSIAMGQGSDAVRSAADWVTLPNEEDGVAHAIDKIILLGTAQ